MRKVLQYLVFIVIGDVLCLKFAFAHDNERFFALFGFLLMGYSIVQLSFKLAEIFTNKKFTYKILMSLDKSDKSYKKVETFTTIILLLLIGLHVGGYIYFVKYQDKMLLERGIITKTIVINKKLENRK